MAATAQQQLRLQVLELLGRLRDRDTQARAIDKLKELCRNAPSPEAINIILSALSETIPAGSSDRRTAHSHSSSIRTGASSISSSADGYASASDGRGAVISAAGSGFGGMLSGTVGESISARKEVAALYGYIAAFHKQALFPALKSIIKVLIKRLKDEKPVQEAVADSFGTIVRNVQIPPLVYVQQKKPSSSPAAVGEPCPNLAPLKTTGISAYFLRPLLQCIETQDRGCQSGALIAIRRVVAAAGPESLRPCGVASSLSSQLLKYFGTSTFVPRAELLLVMAALAEVMEQDSLSLIEPWMALLHQFSDFSAHGADSSMTMQALSKSGGRSMSASRSRQQQAYGAVPSSSSSSAAAAAFSPSLSSSSSATSWRQNTWNEDWKLRKAAADFFSSLCFTAQADFLGVSGSTAAAILERLRYDKVKPVRDAAAQALSALREIQESGALDMGTAVGYFSKPTIPQDEFRYHHQQQQQQQPRIIQNGRGKMHQQPQQQQHHVRSSREADHGQVYGDANDYNNHNNDDDDDDDGRTATMIARQIEREIQDQMRMDQGRGLYVNQHNSQHQQQQQHRSQRHRHQESEEEEDEDDSMAYPDEQPPPPLSLSSQTRGRQQRAPPQSSSLAASSSSTKGYISAAWQGSVEEKMKSICDSSQQRSRGNSQTRTQPQSQSQIRPSLTALPLHKLPAESLTAGSRMSSTRSHSSRQPLSERARNSNFFNNDLVRTANVNSKQNVSSSSLSSSSEPFNHSGLPIPAPPPPPGLAADSSTFPLSAAPLIDASSLIPERDISNSSSSNNAKISAQDEAVMLTKPLSSSSSAAAAAAPPLPRPVSASASAAASKKRQDALVTRLENRIDDLERKIEDKMSELMRSASISPSPAHRRPHTSSSSALNQSSGSGGIMDSLEMRRSNSPSSRQRHGSPSRSSYDRPIISSSQAMPPVSMEHAQMELLLRAADSESSERHLAQQMELARAGRLDAVAQVLMHRARGGAGGGPSPSSSVSFSPAVNQSGVYQIPAVHGQYSPAVMQQQQQQPVQDGIWNLAMQHLASGDADQAFAVVLSSRDDIHLLRLLNRTGCIPYRLSPTTNDLLAVRLMIFLKCGTGNDAIWPWFAALLERGQRLLSERTLGLLQKLVEDTLQTPTPQAQQLHRHLTAARMNAQQPS